MKKVKQNPIDVVNIYNYLNLYDIKSNSRIIKISPLYRICFAKTLSGKDVFTLYDKDMLTEKGLNELSLELMPSKIKLKKFESWKDEYLAGTFLRIIPKVDYKSFFIYLEELKGNWMDMLNYLLDDTGQKDKAICNVIKAAYLPLPLDDRIWQSFNNHAIIVTNSGVGKSKTFERIVGFQPQCDYSVPGLIGTIGEKQNVVGGALNGRGVYGFDEFPQVDEKRQQVLVSLLNYMESGEANRDIAVRINCRGNKCLLFFGNIPYDYDEDSFITTLYKLAGNEALQRVGKRFAHILFGRYKTVYPSFEDVKKVSFLRYILETTIVCEYKKIYKILKFMRPWMEKEEETYSKKIKELIPFCTHKHTKDFLEGLSMSSARLKCASVKLAIINNLDKIVLLKNRKQLLSIISSESHKNFEEFAQYNVDSFKFLLESKKSKAISMKDKGMSIEDIANELNISRNTVWLWLNQRKI